MARASKAGGADIQDSVAMIASAMKGYGNVSEAQAKKIADLSFNTAKLGDTTFKELAANMQPLFPLSNSLNMSYEELYGTMSTLTGVTGDTANVTTQMKGFMSALIKPSTAMKSMMEKYGYASGEAMIKAKGFAGVLGIVKKETGGSSTELGKLFKNQRGLIAATALTGQQYDTYIEKTNKLKNSTNAATVAFEKMEGTPAEKLRKALTRLQNAAIQFGGPLINIITPFIEMFGRAMEKLQEKLSAMPKSMQNFIVKTLLIVAAIGPVLTIFGKLFTSVGGMMRIFGNLGMAMTKAGGILGLLASPMGKFVIASMAIAVAAIVIIKYWKQIKEGAEKLKDIVANAFKASGVNVEGFKTGFKALKHVVKSVVTFMTPIIKFIVTLLKMVTKFVVGSFVANWKLGFHVVIGIISSAVTTFGHVFGGIYTVLNGIIKFIKGAFTRNWSEAWAGVKDIFKGIFGMLGGLAKAPINAIIGMINGLISGINSIGFKIPDKKWIPEKFRGAKFGINISPIPMLADGTSDWYGGPAIVGENGPELLNLPRGSQVINNRQTQRMVTKKIEINKLADKIIIREDADIDKITDAIAEVLELTDANM